MAEEKYCMVSKAPIVVAITFVVILVILTIAYFIFETSSQISPEAIKIYWKGKYTQEWVNPSLYLTLVTSQPNYTVSDLKLIVGDPVSDSTVDFQIECTNFTREVDFLDFVTNDSFVGNFTRLYEYEKANQPDIMVKSTLIKNGSFLTWSQVWNSVMDFNTISVDCKPFLKQVSYDTWEGKWLFDGSSDIIDLNGTPFATANVSKVSFNVKVPRGYIPQNTESSSLHEVSGGFIVEKSITSGDTFHLVIVDNNLASIKAVMDYVIGALGVISLVMGAFLSWLGSRLYKQWHKQRSRKASRHR
jgi:hypothetical protein